jgi:hypothetical protein
MALAMPLGLTWAPLGFGLLSALAPFAIGLHLRKLGREAAHELVGRPILTERHPEPDRSPR